MRSTKWATVAVAVIALGAAGCGASDSGTEGAAAPVLAPPQPRPQGTGPLTKDVVRTDLDTSAADAGVPANAPEFGGMNEDAEAGSPRSCALGFKGFGTKAAKVDVARWESVVGELRERDWQQAREPDKRRGPDGVVYDARVVLKQRGWTMVAEYLSSQVGVITLLAYDDACMKKINADAGQAG
ncbi:hypothetical protein ACFYWP_39905 [Actinacidiphila glaucinigra]|uniref:hypothetical protein n=1 Tax=Actinacidiphila glaucinigra TaxID=235986 RepID=UPI0036A91F4C